MIRKHPWLVGAAFGGLVAIANAQTIGGFGGGGGGGGGLAGFTSDGTGISGSGTTITVNDPILNLTQTWNNAGVVFTGIKENITNSASSASSLLIDLQVGAASKFNVDESGNLTVPGNMTSQGGGVILGSSTILQGLSFGELDFSLTNGTNRVKLTAVADAVLGLGSADAAAPVAQTLQVQSVAAGNSNTAAVPFTFNASRGTGTLTSGNIIFQTAPAGLSSTNQNPLVQAFIIEASTHIRAGAMTAPSISSCGGGSPAVSGTDTDGQITFGTTATTCTLTWTTAYNNKPYCVVTWQNNLATMQYTPSNTNILLAQTSTSGNVAHYHCVARNGG